MAGRNKKKSKMLLPGIRWAALLMMSVTVSACGSRSAGSETGDMMTETVPELTEKDPLVPDGDPVNGGEIAIDVIAANDVGNLAGAAVMLCDGNGTVIDERIADDMGGVVFAGVREGSYTVSCEAEGYYGRSVTVSALPRERSSRVVPLVPEVMGTEAYVLLEWHGEPQIDLDLCLFDAESGEYTDSAHSMDSDGNALYADRSFWDGYELLMIRDAQSSAERSIYVLDWITAGKVLEPGPDEGEGSEDPEASAAALAAALAEQGYPIGDLVPETDPDGTVSVGTVGTDPEGTVNAGADGTDPEGTVNAGADGMDPEGIVNAEADGADPEGLTENEEDRDDSVSMMEGLDLELYIYTAEGEVCRITPDPTQDAPLWRVATVRDGKVTENSEYISDLTNERWTLLEPEGQIRREAMIVPEWKEAYRKAVTEELPKLCDLYGAGDYENCVYYILHIDGDEYPELVIENPGIAGENTLILSYTGAQIASCYKPGFGGWQYIPGSGKILFGALTDGRMDYELLLLREGSFTTLKSGYTSSYESNGSQLTAYPEGQERCSWGGVPIIGYINFEETMKQDFDMSLTRDPDILNEADYTRLAGYLDSGE